jgi:hypothetical protein
MSLLDEAIFGMKAKDFGTPALDRTSKKAAAGEPVTLGFTTYMLQRDAAEEEEQQAPSPTDEDPQLTTFYKDVEVMNMDQAAEYLYNAVTAGKVSLQNFKEILSAVFDVQNV